MRLYPIQSTWSRHPSEPPFTDAERAQMLAEVMADPTRFEPPEPTVIVDKDGRRVRIRYVAVRGMI